MGVIPIGTRFGKLTVVAYAGKNKKRAALWLCKCDCGKEKALRGIKLRAGKAKSCGCLIHVYPDLLERLPKKVTVTATGCWEWRTPRDRGRPGGKAREVWTRMRGPIPDGLFVCHDCPGGDNPRCVNPEHLFLGTHQENMADAVAKGTVAHGEKHYRAKLTPELAVEIFRQFHQEGVSRTDLGRRFGIERASVGDIVRRKNWRRATEKIAQELLGETP